MRKFLFAGAFVTMTGALIAVHWLLRTLRLPGHRAVTLGYYRLLCRLFFFRKIHWDTSGRVMALNSQTDR